MSSSLTLVIPCYNEARRLDSSELVRLCRARPELQLLLVDDGSTDETPRLLEALCDALPGRAQALRLSPNRGKAEAVRQGLLQALSAAPKWVGFADADLSTPVDELVRLIALSDDASVDVLLGARVRLLGSAIERRPARHLLGRVFATAASFSLGLPIYDTQCGAKLFRNTAALAEALADPFGSRWIFDVELLARLLRAGGPAMPARIREVPLHRWRDVAGSKLKAKAMIGAGWQLLSLMIRLRREPRPAAPSLPFVRVPAPDAATEAPAQSRLRRAAGRT